MEINIAEYLSHEEVRQIVIDTIRGRTEKMFSERVLSNMAYNCAWKILDDTLTDEALQTIEPQVKKIIGELTGSSLFRKKNAWDAEESVAYTELQKAVSDNIPLIHKKVRDVIENYNYEGFLQPDEHQFVDVVVEALKLGFSQMSDR